MVKKINNRIQLHLTGHGLPSAACGVDLCLPRERHEGVRVRVDAAEHTHMPRWTSVFLGRKSLIIIFLLLLLQCHFALVTILIFGVLFYSSLGGGGGGAGARLV